MILDKYSQSLTDLIIEIHTVNQSWKLASEIFDNEYFLSKRLRELKTRLQIKLLKEFAPEYVYLQEDKETESEEALYGLKLVFPINNYNNAAHLPIRVVQNKFSLEEITTFSQQ